MLMYLLFSTFTNWEAKSYFELLGPFILNGFSKSFFISKEKDRCRIKFSISRQRKIFMDFQKLAMNYSLC